MTPKNGALSVTLASALVLSGCLGDGNFLGQRDANESGLEIALSDSVVTEVVFDDALRGLPLALEAIAQSLENVVLDSPDIGFALAQGETRDYDVVNGASTFGRMTLGFSEEKGLVISATGVLTGPEAFEENMPFALQLATRVPLAELNLENDALLRTLAASSMSLSGEVSNEQGLNLVSFRDVNTRMDLNRAMASASAAIAGEVVLRSTSGEKFEGRVEARLPRSGISGSAGIEGARIAIEQLRFSGELTSAGIINVSGYELASAH